MKLLTLGCFDFQHNVQDNVITITDIDGEEFTQDFDSNIGVYDVKPIIVKGLTMLEVTFYGFAI